MPDGDAQLMASVPDNSYDWVHSSHCLEHMRDAKEALSNWYRILKPGRYLVALFPDWELYEGKVWPSRFNPDHKQRFSLTVKEDGVTDPRDILPEGADLVRCTLLENTMPDYRIEGMDYSVLPGCEPAIELVLRKPE
jgi:SAM-dependent methyltransferase